MAEQEKKTENTPSEIVHPKVLRRATALMAIAFCLFALLLIRILLYQTVGYDKYQRKVIEQMTTESAVLADRGNIYDAKGVLLASNVTTYRVFIAPSAIAAAQVEMREQGEDIRLDSEISEELAKLLSVNVQFVMEQMTYTTKLDRTIKNKVDENTADRVREAIAENGWHQFVHLQATSTRYYPYSSMASHVLGFTGSDGTGLYGLEYYYNEQLAGTNGRYIIARDAQGNEMPYGYEEFIEAEDGYHLNTTLDVFVQAALEEQLQTAYIEAGGQNRASGIVMNVNTGAILGMATYPYFNLNDPWTLDSQSEEKLLSYGLDRNSEDYSKARQELLMQMWSNKAINESYIPGSTFKVITAAMTIEEAVVKPEDVYTKVQYNCPGHKVVTYNDGKSKQLIHCHKTHGHGSLTFAQGIQQSCNPVLMTVGLELGRDTFYQYLSAFGYKEKSGIDLSGEGYSILSTYEKFTDLDLAIYAFGQNFNVTLIQQITAVSAVANGGYLVTPHLISSITDHNGNVIKDFEKQIRRQVVSTATCKTVCDILEKGVSGDGGAKNAYVAGYRVAAKTGTSEKKDAGKEGMYVCSTVAFAPADNPQYAVIIIVDEPTKGVLYGSTVAAPYVGNVMETILPYLGVEAVYTDAELENMTVTVPSRINWSASAAKRNLEGSEYGLEVEIIGDPDGVVLKQYPVKDTVVEKSSGKVYLYTTKEETVEPVEVPDVLNMGAQQANFTVIDSGLNIRILGTRNYLSGTGVKVISQSIAPGTMVPPGTVLEVTFRYLEADDYYD